jgi:tetratricopeptide (TPR) repeat protein
MIKLAIILLSILTINYSYASEEDFFDINKPAKIQKANAEFVYKFLLAEIAAQRGDLTSAGHLYYDLAKLTKNIPLAQRATNIAGYARNGRLALDSAELWRQLDNDSLEAKQILAELFISSGNLAKARPIIEKLLEQEKTRADGFLYLNNLLNKVENKKNALRFILAISKLYPELAEAHFSIAHAAYFAGDFKLAEKELDIAESIKPNWETAALFRGYMLAKDWPEKALEFYQSFLNENPNSNEVRLEYAKILANLKMYSKAKSEFLRLVDGSLASPEISLTVALLSLELNDNLLAEKFLNQALERGYSDRDKIQIYLAKIYLDRKEPDMAITFLDKISSGQLFVEAKILTAEIIAENRSVDDGIAFLAQYKNLNSNDKLQFLKAKTSLLYNNNRQQDAFDLMKSEDSNFNNSAEFKFDYAMIAEKMGNLLLMEQLLKEAIKLKPDYAYAYNALGYSYADRNIKLADAKKYIEIALSISPNNHYIMDSMGWLHFRMGNIEIALQFIEKAYKIQKDPEIAAHLGEILWKMGKLKQAKKVWEESMKTYPSNTVLLETFERLQ